MESPFEPNRIYSVEHRDTEVPSPLVGEYLGLTVYRDGNGSSDRADPTSLITDDDGYEYHEVIPAELIDSWEDLGPRPESHGGPGLASIQADQALTPLT